MRRLGPLAPALLLCLSTASTVRGQETEAVWDSAVFYHYINQPLSGMLSADGDAWMDFIGSSTKAFSTFSYRYVTLHRGHPSGTLPPWATFQVTDLETNKANRDEHPLSTATGDIGVVDGREEIVVAYQRKIHVLAWSSTEVALVPQALFNAPGTVLTATTGDFDGDGTGDFAVLLEDRIVVYLHPDGTPVQRRILPLHGGAWTHLESGDLSPGAGDELLVVGETYATVQSLEPPAAPGGRQKIRRAPPLFLHRLQAPDPAIGDIDGDGDDDVVLFAMDADVGGRYRVLRQRSSRLVIEGKRVGGPATDLADVDADGDLDGICCGGGGSGGESDAGLGTPSNFEVCLNDGAGDFELSFKIPSIAGKQIAGAADVDQDGDVDLVAGQTVYFAPGKISAPAPTLGGGATPEASRICDVDGDGDPDLEFGLDGCRLNLGDGRFVDAAANAPAPPSGMTYRGPGFPGDLDGNGAADLIVELWDGATFQGVHLLKNDGGGTLDDAGIVATPAQAFSATTTLEADNCVVADFDSDGHTDFAVLSERQSPVLFTWLWLNDGAGSFTAGPLWTDERLLGADDISGDGLTDLIVYRDGIQSRLGDGQGGFEELASLAVYGAFSEAEDYDVHRDELSIFPTWGNDVPDVVAIQRVPEVGHAFRNAYMLNVDGTYPGVVGGIGLPRTEEHPFYALSGDADGDGWQELFAAADPGAPSVSWIKRGPVTSSTGSGDVKTLVLRATAIADVDGDGDDDALSEVVRHGRGFEGVAGGARVQYGTSFAGTDGRAPTLGATGPFRVGETIEFRVRGGLGGATCTFAISRAPAELPDTPVPGLTSWVDPSNYWFQTVTVTLSGAPGEPGVGTAVIPFTVPAGYYGTSEYFQAMIDDPGTLSGLSATNGLRIDFGG